MILTRRSHDQWRAGFTLLEVMVALAIIGIALVTCLSLTLRCTQSHEQIQKMTLATLLVQHKMTELEAQARQSKLDFTPQQALWDEPYTDYRWQVHYTDTVVSGVQQVTVSVFWGDEQRNEGVTIDSFMFK